MKRLKSTSVMIALMAVTMGFCGCSSDDENTGSSLTYEDLEGHWYLETSNDDLSVALTFNKGGNGKVIYQYSYYPGDDEYEITASGFYSVDGSSLTANYSEVDVYTSTGCTTYDGFTDGQPKSVTYTVVSFDGDAITLRDVNGTTIRFEK